MNPHERLKEIAEALMRFLSHWGWRKMERKMEEDACQEYFAGDKDSIIVTGEWDVGLFDKVNLAKKIGKCNIILDSRGSEKIVGIRLYDNGKLELIKGALQ